MHNQALVTVVLSTIYSKKDSLVSYELYSLDKDPMETDNLIEEKSHERFQQMELELNNWLLSVVNSLNGKDY